MFEDDDDFEETNRINFFNPPLLIKNQNYEIKYDNEEKYFYCGKRKCIVSLDHCNKFKFLENHICYNCDTNTDNVFKVNYENIPKLRFKFRVKDNDKTKIFSPNKVAVLIYHHDKVRLEIIENGEHIRYINNFAVRRKPIDPNNKKSFEQSVNYYKKIIKDKYNVDNVVAYIKNDVKRRENSIFKEKKYN